MAKVIGVPSLGERTYPREGTLFWFMFSNKEPQKVRTRTNRTSLKRAKLAYKADLRKAAKLLENKL